MKRWLWLGAFVLLSSFVHAGDNWQNRPTACKVDELSALELMVCRTWIAEVTQQDYPLTSCCGEGDAFIADDFEAGPNGETIAIVTQDYPGEMPKGTKIVIPTNKINKAYMGRGNPTGHGVVFIGSTTKSVLCWFAPTGL